MEFVNRTRELERITRVLFLKSKPRQIPPGILIFTPVDIINAYSSG
jgi:hypothetical protein